MKFWQNYEFCVIKLRAKKHKKTKQKQNKNKNKTKQKTNKKQRPLPPPNKKNKCILIGSCEKSSEQFLAIAWRRQAQFSLGG
jgi:ribosomal protein S10